MAPGHPSPPVNGTDDLRLSPDEDLDTGFRRILDGLTGDALDRLGTAGERDPVGSVHEARKRCKETRALLRLLQPTLDARFHPADHAFRDAARLLGPIRDAQAQQEVFGALVASDDASGRDLAAIRSALARDAARADAAVGGPGHGPLGRAADLIAHGREVASSAGIPGGFDVIGRGLGVMYRRARTAMHRAIDSGDAHDYHRWRKRVKYLWYEVRLTEAWAPPLLVPLEEALRSLSQVLGDVHDLVVLTDHLARVDPDVPRGERRATARLAERRRLELEHRARHLGAGIFAEDPEAFVTRLRSETRSTGDR